MREKNIYRARVKEDGTLRVGSFINGKVPCLKEGRMGRHLPIYLDSLAQCTGFQDMCGNWVFEGDVLEHINDYIQFWKVQWVNGAFALVAKDCTVPSYKFLHEEATRKYLADCKVVDNENPTI